MTQLYKLKSSARRDPGADNLFSGIWIRWRALTVGERFVCANIVLLPVWWVVGLFYYMPLLLLLGVALYEWWQHGEVRLKHPNLPVVALLAFGTYQLVRILFSYYEPRTVTFTDVILISFCPAFWLWYISSKDIRIRMEVVAWACTVSVVQMLGFWVLIQFVLPENFFWSSRFRTVLGLFTSKRDKTFYLFPYIPRTVLEGVNRFSLFFLYPEFFALVTGFMGLVALEIKNRLWSWLLLLACVFLIFLSATRIVWVAFPIVVGLRYLFSTFSKRRRSPVIFALIAVASFTIFTFPPTSDLILTKFISGAESINNVRADSTDTRLEIYRQTWEGIQDNFLWGYMSKGPPVAVFRDSRVGSHSAILGSLLYQTGLVGTGLFTVFWILLFIWFYETGAGRPLIGFCVLIFYTLVSPTMALVYDIPISSLIVLLCAAIRRPKLKSVQGVRHA
jgi:hypothetical protein